MSKQEKAVVDAEREREEIRAKYMAGGMTPARLEYELAQVRLRLSQALA